ncbi:MAG: enoyl-CoA hydratase/isomerase family protein [Actinomycetota bacterium]
MEAEIVGFETIRYAVEDGLATITLARPDKRNAVNQAMFTELGDTTEKAAADPYVRAVLVVGDGPSFCAGIDLSLIGELAGLAAQASDDEGGFHSFVRHAQRPFRSLSRMPKPTVAALQGHAIGAGFQLALACDLRVATPDAKFSMLEARYGLIPDLGGAHRLARLVGPSRSKEIVWSTRMVEAEEAFRIGLVDRLVDRHALRAEAQALARQVTQHSPTAVALVKELIERATETPLDDEYEREAEGQTAALRGEDHREAVSAFLEGRPPRFSSS